MCEHWQTITCKVRVFKAIITRYFRSLISGYNCISSPQERRLTNQAAFLVCPDHCRVR
jgi:hypothetical protein